jgi:PilZ domain
VTDSTDPIGDSDQSSRRGERKTGDRRRDEQAERQERRRGNDRRAAARIPLEMWMEEVEKGHTALRRTGDVSVGGAYFDRIVPHPLGTRIALRIPLPGEDREVRVYGEVVNLEKDGTGMGVKFVEFDGEGEQHLGAFLEKAGATAGESE